jgi:hypothetical protein
MELDGVRGEGIHLPLEGVDTGLQRGGLAVPDPHHQSSHADDHRRNQEVEENPHRTALASAGAPTVAACFENRGRTIASS